MTYLSYERQSELISDEGIDLASLDYGVDNNTRLIEVLSERLSTLQSEHVDLFERFTDLYRFTELLKDQVIEVLPRLAKASHDSLALIAKQVDVIKADVALQGDALDMALHNLNKREGE